MSFKIVLFPNLNLAEGHPIWDASPLQDEMAANNKHESFRHKVVVLEESGKEENLTLVIGPIFVFRFGHPQNYRHFELVSIATQSLGKEGQQYQIKGGGQINFSYRGESLPPSGWAAHFDGASHEYGQLGQRLDAHSQEVADWLGISVETLRRGVFHPEKK